jgi:hypothetical protein
MTLAKKFSESQPIRIAQLELASVLRHTNSGIDRRPE